MRPACMTQDEFDGWSAHNAVLRNASPLPCQDCPVAFAQEMRAAGCCNGEPGSMIRSNATDRRRAQWREAKRRHYARQRATA